MAEPDAHAQTSVTSGDGSRTLTGVGVSADALEAVVDRHEPDEAPAAPSTPDTPATPATNEPPQLAKGRARYSELTRQRDAEKTRAEAAEKKAADLEARLQQPPAPTPAAGTATAPVAERVGSAPVAETRPEPSEDEIGSKYPTYGAFVKDLQQWAWEQNQAEVDRRIRASIDADRSASQFQSHVDQTRVKGRELYADFDQQLTQGPGALVSMHTDRLEAIIRHPASSHLQYAIAKDEAVARRLASCPALEFGAELAKLVPAPQAPPLPLRQSAPPAPMQPVGSSSRTAMPASAEHAKSGNYEAYKAARAAERGRGRR